MLNRISGWPLIVFTSFATAIVLSASIYAAYLAPAIIIAVLSVRYEGIRKLMLPGIVLTLLISSSDIVQDYREYINASAYFIAFLMFFEAYGLNYRKYPVPPGKLLFFVSGFLLLIFFSAYLSDRPQVGFVFFLKQLVFFLLIYLIYADVKKRNNLEIYIFALILTGCILSLAILISFLTSDSAVYYLMTKSMIREGGIFGNVAAAAAILLITLSLTIARFLLNKKDRKKKNLLGALIFLQSLGLLMTNSRAALLGFYFSLAIIIYNVNKKYFKAYILVSAISAVLIFVILPEQIDFLLNYIRIERILENERWKLWHVAENIIRDHPFFGAGPGQFKYYIYYYNPTMLGSWEELQMRWVYDVAGLGHAHNIYLFLTSELGIGGLISIFAFFYVFYHFGFRPVNIKYFYYKVSVIAAGTGLFVRSFFESTGILTYGWIIRDLPLWTIFILLIYLINENERTDERLQERSVR